MAGALGAAVTVVLTIGGCGTTPGNGGDQSTWTSPPTTTNGNVVTVTGTVIAGVEPGCLVLDTDAGQYLLIDRDHPLLDPGRRVIVRGATRPGIPTTCMQGIPLEVRDVRAVT